MMEEKKAFDLCRQRQSDDVIDAAVAPVNVLRVLLAIILRIHDQHVCAAQKIRQLPVLALREDLLRLFLSGNLRRMPITGMRFVIRKKGHRTRCRR